jgi:small subunit ribosomal protein S6e
LKIIVNDTKTGKSYQKEMETPQLTGKKIGEEIDGGIIELSGYTLKITGGSDKSGFPLRKGITTRRANLVTGRSVGVRTRKNTKVKRKVSGETINNDTAQLNLKIIKPGSTDLSLVFPAKAKEEKKA